MKKLSTLLESFDSNPGNSMKLGVMNHLTPISNIITNIRNLFGCVMGIVVEPGEDGVSLKLHSSSFCNPEATEKILNTPYLGNTNLKTYICQQGLCNIKIINIGQYCIVYCGPTDIKTADSVKKVTDKIKGDTGACTDKDGCLVKVNAAVTEMVQYNIEECEITSLNESIDDEELEDKTKEQLLKFIKGEDKVKAAEKLSELLATDIQLPPDYYFKGVKDTDGNESIALRYKFTKRRPFGKTIELTKSLLNIYSTGTDAVWVEAFLYRDKNSAEMNYIINTVLKLIGAEKTDDPCVYTIPDDTIADLKQDVKDYKKEKEDNDDDDSTDDTDDLKKKTSSEISGTLKYDNDHVNAD